MTLILTLIWMMEVSTEHSKLKITILKGGLVGAVHCCVCDSMVPPGKGSPEENGVDIFGSLANYEVREVILEMEIG